MQHDVRLAAMLCFSAGFVNAAGFLAFQVLTTNITGHAALVAMHTARGELRAAAVAAMWLGLFFCGAFASGVIARLATKHSVSAYTIPLLAIVAIITAVAVGGDVISTWPHARSLMAGSLLLAMGMQNALVTMVSDALVRTTHLTGMFTDLGIDLSTIVYGRITSEVGKRILLRITIICFFLLGGFFGGILYHLGHYASFGVPAAIMLIALFYDYFRIGLKKVMRKSAAQHHE
jgi:uncharacterized membrane protein YoaK (UPF0700 family)